MALTFVLFLLAFVAVGLLSARARGEGADDYWLAGRSLPPWAMALSTLSTAQSGFLFLGMVGLSYAKGLTALWMLAGWLGGDYLVWRLGVIDRIRRTSEARGATTLPSFLGPQERAGEEGKRPLWVAIAALALFALLSLSASGQLTSGAKVLSGLYGWPRWAGLGLTALIVTSYCFAGGVRASVWTDCAQGPVMIVGMLWLMSAGLIAVGGPGELWARLQAEYPGHLALTENWGWALVGLLGWTISGMGTSGQPHVLSRAFMIDDPDNLVRARRWYFGLGLLLYGTVVVAGLCARLLVPAGALADNELAIVTIAEQLLPAPVVGLMVAGIFAAVISTVDSMVIVQSSVLVNDVAPEGAELPASATKGFTLLAMLLALAFGAFQKSVLSAVLLAWYFLACGFGPLVILRAFGVRLDGLKALLIGGIGVGGYFLYLHFDPKQTYFAAMSPAFLIAIATGFLLFRERAEEPSGEPAPIPVETEREDDGPGA